MNIVEKYIKIKKEYQDLSSNKEITNYESERKELLEWNIFYKLIIPFLTTNILWNAGVFIYADLGVSIFDFLFVPDYFFDTDFFVFSVVSNFFIGILLGSLLIVIIEIKEKESNREKDIFGLIFFGFIGFILFYIINLMNFLSIGFVIMSLFNFFLNKYKIYKFDKKIKNKCHNKKSMTELEQSLFDLKNEIKNNQDALNFLFKDIHKLNRQDSFIAKQLKKEIVDEKRKNLNDDDILNLLIKSEIRDKIINY